MSRLGGMAPSETYRSVRDGVGIEVDLFGASSAPVVVLLHGFPDDGSVWRHQVPALVEAGWRVLVPDLRGAGRSDRPEPFEAYALWQLADDVIAVLDHFEIERAHIVGHDLGSALAWYLAIVAPDRVDHLAALAVGHPLAFRGVGPEQLQKSWYIFLFQFPDVAESWMRSDEWATLRSWLHHPDIDDVIERLARPGALQAAISWYRANVTPASLVGPPLELPPVAAPTLGVWASGDLALTERQMTDSEHYVSGPFTYHRLDGVGHWFPLEGADVLNPILSDFLPTTV